MNAARVSSPPRPAKKGQAYLWRICIRLLLIFALALLPLIAAGVALVMGLREKTVTARQEEQCEISETDAGMVDAEASVAE